jgi:hypothetical protein
MGELKSPAEFCKQYRFEAARFVDELQECVRSALLEAGENAQVRSWWHYAVVVPLVAAASFISMQAKEHQSTSCAARTATAALTYRSSTTPLPAPLSMPPFAVTFSSTFWRNVGSQKARESSI